MCHVRSAVAIRWRRRWRSQHVGTFSIRGASYQILVLTRKYTRYRTVLSTELVPSFWLVAAVWVGSGSVLLCSSLMRLLRRSLTLIAVFRCLVPVFVSSLHPNPNRHLADPQSQTLLKPDTTGDGLGTARETREKPKRERGKYRAILLTLFTARYIDLSAFFVVVYSLNRGDWRVTLFVTNGPSVCIIYRHICTEYTSSNYLH